MNDDRLSWLLEDAVADVEPADRLHEIRSRLRPPRQRWLYIGGALVTAAATIAVIAVSSGNAPNRAIDPVNPLSPSSSLHSTPSPSSEVPAEGVAPEPVTLYWLGNTPRGDRLFSEPTRLNVAYGETRLSAAVRTAIQGQPTDPDYRTVWNDAEVLGVTRQQDLVEVQLASRSKTTNGLALWQVAYTVWSVLNQRVAVRFTGANTPSGQFGTYVDGMIEPGDLVDELVLQSPLQIGYPSEGDEVHEAFGASGLASSNQAKIEWRLEDDRGNIVLEGLADAVGSKERLYPWRAQVNVKSLAPGTYTFIATTATAKADLGTIPATDTRTIIVQ